ncbi:hypothetical protein [Streptomyces mutabilis]|uniref:hypothetical protein n=1 Tax=Streptomyces mutabilis TaxID=67332 RepID=UPI00177CED09|nr:hypothetical protein [Streptomyces mutabilis]GGP99796.1 hypothetical protein GCM10010279_03290 [Streptomyces mutabilis]
MSEFDERRIKEWAKQPSRVLRGKGGPAAREEARKVLEWQALMRGEPQDPRSSADGGG